MASAVLTITLLLLLLPPRRSYVLSVSASESDGSTICPDTCGNVPVAFPFGVRDGCGARQFRNMFNCSSSSSSNSVIDGGGGGQLFFQTPSGGYGVKSIDYRANTMVIYDPAMSTCGGSLQPRHDFALSDEQYLNIFPSPDTFFALLNCSADSPLLHRLSRVCAPTLSGHTCDELYSCPAFQLLQQPGGGNGSSVISSSSSSGIGNGSSIFGSLPPPPPPSASPVTLAPSSCCFTRYDTLKYMSMEMLDCTHYAMVSGAYGLKGVSAADWTYGIKLSYNVPDVGCDRCRKSGGACGFDTETQGDLCICSASLNSTTTACGDASINGEERLVHPPPLLKASAFATAVGVILFAVF